MCDALAATGRKAAAKETGEGHTLRVPLLQCAGSVKPGSRASESEKKDPGMGKPRSWQAQAGSREQGGEGPAHTQCGENKQHSSPAVPQEDWQSASSDSARSESIFQKVEKSQCSATHIPEAGFPSQL